MRISGQGISGYKTLHVQRDFKVNTQLALKWAQTSSGKWVAADRLAASDVYKTKISLSTIESSTTDVPYTVNDLITDLYANRVVAHADANKIFIDWIYPNEDEKIFGCDVDYSSGVTAYVLEIGERKQKSFHTFTVDVELIAERPLSFISPSAGSTIEFDHIDIGYVGTNTYTFMQNEIYGSNPYTTDRRADSGVIDFIATVSIDDMVKFRRLLTTQRSAPITTTSLKGVTYPFGPVRDNTWPKNLKYIRVRDLGMWGQQYYRVECRCVEDL